MSQNHIILRSRRALTRDPSTGVLTSRSSTDSFADLQVEVESISRSRVADLSDRADVIAVAPTMPMKLVAPVKRDEAVEAPATSTWGIKAVQADKSPFTGDGIIISVLDTGIDAAHAAFTGVEIIQKDFTGEGDGDQEGHGTHCAGTILGRDVKGTRIGVAPGVKKALIGKVLGGQGGSSETICTAMMWAIENGANVISMSLGIDFPGYVRFLIDSESLPAEIATSRALGDYRANVQLFSTMAELIEARSIMNQATIVVAAAGNESQRDQNPNWKIGVAPPAIAKGIISVAAVGESTAGFTVAPFSNTGANIAGPGVNIVSARAGGGLTAMSGTSMATPHLAGLAALWAEKLNKVNGRLTTLALTSRLMASATDEGMKTGFDPFDIGAGVARAPQS